MQIEEIDEILARMESRALVIGKERSGKTMIRTPSFVHRNCTDCGSTVEPFMVHDSIWKSSGFEPNELGCQPCLEKRLGRRLTIEDFTAALTNVNIFRAYRMALGG